MNTRTLFLSLAIVFTLTFISSQAIADDGTFDPCDISSWSMNTTDFVHVESSTEFKGWAIFTFTNTMTQDWGDFHFVLNPDTVIFTEPPTGSMKMFVGDATSATEYSNYSYEIDALDNWKLDFKFYGNPVEQDEQITFKIYTNNTSAQNTFFTICLGPSPVPEPATIAILGLGALVLLRRRK